MPLRNRVKKRARRAIKTKKTPFDSQLQLRSDNEVRKVEQRLRKAQDAYYNTDKPLMSDSKYDLLEQKLRRLAPGSKILRRIETLDTRAARKTPLPYPMPSLDKPKLGKPFDRWLDDNPGPYTISDKLDGASAMYTADGKLFTRGTSGIVGSDITHLIPHIRGIGKLPAGIKAIRGELVFARTTFMRKYAAQYENSRNLASGVVNKLNGIHEAARDLMFVVHKVMEPDRLLSAVAAKLKSNGFVVVTFVQRDNLDEAFLLQYLAQRREKGGHDIDGLVVATNDNMVAFKAGYETAQAEVLRVEWNESRYGFLKPTVILKKGVRLAGATLVRFTAHNAKMVVEGKINTGAIIEVTRAGEVIPKIMRVLKPSKLDPYPKGFGSKYQWNETKVDLVAISSSKSMAAKVQELVTFLIRIDVDKVKSGIVEKLVAVGIDTIPALVEATVEELEDADIGSATAAHLHDRLRSRLKLVELDALMAGSNTFDRGFGTTRFQSILNEIDFKQQLTVYKRSKDALIKRIAIIPGIGEKSARSYVTSLPRFIKFLQQIKWKPTKRVARKVRKSGLGLAPIVVLTGFRDKKLEAQIKEVGGKIGNTVTKNTTHLVVLDAKHTSRKTAAAEKYGVKIVPLQKFLQLLKKTS